MRAKYDVRDDVVKEALWKLCGICQVNAGKLPSWVRRAASSRSLRWREGWFPNEMSQNAFLRSAALEPPPARSRLLSRSCCPP